MRTYVLIAVAAALFVLPTAAFSEQIDIGPGGVRIGPDHHHHYYSHRYERGEPRLYNRYEGHRYGGGPRPYHRDRD
jgi:hypothetical protein